MKLKETLDDYMEMTIDIMNELTPVIRKVVGVELYDDPNTDVILLNMSMFRQSGTDFVKLLGTIFPYEIGDIIEVDGKDILVDVTNYFEYGRSYTLSIPKLILLSNDEDEIRAYLRMQDKGVQYDKSIYSEDVEWDRLDEIQKYFVTSYNAGGVH